MLVTFLTFVRKKKGKGRRRKIWPHYESQFITIFISNNLYTISTSVPPLSVTRRPFAQTYLLLGINNIRNSICLNWSTKNSSCAKIFVFSFWSCSRNERKHIAKMDFFKVNIFHCFPHKFECFRWNFFVQMANFKELLFGNCGFVLTLHFHSIPFFIH